MYVLVKIPLFPMLFHVDEGDMRKREREREKKIKGDLNMLCRIEVLGILRNCIVLDHQIAVFFSYFLLPCVCHAIKLA